MAAQQLPSAYSLSALSSVFPAPISAQAAPTTSDFAQIGQVWVNAATGDAYMLTMIASNLASWDQINQGSSGIFSSITVTPGDVTVTDGDIIVDQGDITATLGDIIAAAGDIVATLGDVRGNTITSDTGVTVTTGNVLVSSGDVVVSSGDIGTTNGVIVATNSIPSGAFAELQVQKNRSGGVILSGDPLGKVDFLGFDGSSYVSGGSIEVVSTGTIAANRVAGDMVFFTHPDAASGAVDRLTILSDGQVVISAPDTAGAPGLLVEGGGIRSIPATTSGNTTTQVLDAYVGKVTTTGLTTAAAASVTLTVTNSFVTATSPVLVTVATQGTNDAQLTITRVKEATGSFAVVLVNNGTQAVNGDVIMTFWIVS